MPIIRSSDRHSLEQVLLSASEPVLLAFELDGRPPCRAIRPWLRSVSRRRQVTVVALDLDLLRDLAAHLGVRMAPTLLLVENTEIVGLREGASCSSLLDRWLETALRQSRPKIQAGPPRRAEGP